MADAQAVDSPCGPALLAITLLLFIASGCGGTDAERARAPEKSLSVEEVAPPDEPEEELVEVPDVVGMDGQEAVDTLEPEGFTATHDELDPADCTVEEQDEIGEVEPEAEIILTLDCRQRDWENQEGDDWDAFDRASPLRPMTDAGRCSRSRRTAISTTKIRTSSARRTAL